MVTIMKEFDSFLEAFMTGDYFFNIFLMLMLIILIVLVLALVKTRNDYMEVITREEKKLDSKRLPRRFNLIKS
ncbi:MAG: hypothetical protein L6V81_00490 [Clostridium sp.]|nr:MAG: hypothetical protein L6V81_00490 [Clostridium sp.]